MLYIFITVYFTITYILDNLGSPASALWALDKKIPFSKLTYWVYSGRSD